MNKVLDAIRFADERHAGQKRRGSGHDYVSHPVSVSYIVAEFKRSKYLIDILVAAILHDVMEDTATTFAELAERFSPMSASLVQELTNDPDEIKRVGKLEYHKKKLVALSSYALVIKLADRLDNVRDNAAQKMLKETLELMLHLSQNRKLTNTQERLVEAIIYECNKRITQ